MKATWTKQLLRFHKPAGTSRGVLLDKPAYFIRLQNESTGFTAIGECGMLPGLSADDRPGYEIKLEEVVESINSEAELPELKEWPSIALGLEMAQRNYKNGHDGIIFPSPFSKGSDTISINGLVWMGSAQDMQRQIDEKLLQGFNCVKLKIGAIDFAEELRLLAYIRERYPADVIEIRVDANGAFSANEAPRKLESLAKFHLHSIEQPIKAGQWKAMAGLCASSPLRIALDEELIGLFTPEARREMMETIRPQAIVLKPSFLGNFAVSDEWISRAEQQGATWWITSALESNVGLNAIAQYTYTRLNKEHQGLGTGALYSNNIDSPLEISEGRLRYSPHKDWNFSALP